MSAQVPRVHKIRRNRNSNPARRNRNSNPARRSRNSNPTRRSRRNRNPIEPGPDRDLYGTVVKNGQKYALRDSSGAVYMLDDTDRAKPFEGKTVKVTGQLDEEAKVIHVESIESVEA